MTKPKIVKIVLTKEEQEKLDRAKTLTGKRNIEQSIRGTCSKCNNYATIKVIRKIEDAQLVERFCDKHYRR